MGVGVGYLGTMKSAYFSRCLPFLLLFIVGNDIHLDDFEE